MTMPELKAKLSLDLKNYNEQVKAAQISGKKLEEQLENIKKVGLGFAAVGGAVTASLGLVVKSFISTTSEINDASKALQISTTQFQQLSFVASQTGTDVGALSMGIKTLSRTIAGAADGQKNYIDNLAAVGLKYEDLISLSPEKQIEVVGQAIAAIPNPTQRAAASLELLGKSGTTLLEAAAQMQELSKEAVRLGVVIDTDVIAAGDALGDSFETISMQTKALVANIGASLAPTLMSVTKSIQEVLAAVIGFIRENPKLVTTITMSAGIIGGLALAFGGLLTAITVITPALGFFGVTLSAAIWPVTAIAAAIGAVIALFVYWEDVVYGLQQAYRFTLKFILNFYKSIADGLIEIYSFFENFTDSVPKLFITLYTGLKRLMNDYIIYIGNGIMKIVDAYMGILKLIPGIGSAIKSATDSVKNTVNGVISENQRLAKSVDETATGLKSVLIGISEALSNKLKEIDNDIVLSAEERERRKLEAVKVAADEASTYEVQTRAKTDEELKKLDEERRKAIDAEIAYKKAQFDDYTVWEKQAVLEAEKAIIMERLALVSEENAAYFELKRALYENEVAMRTQVNENLLNMDTSLTGGLASIWSNYQKKWKDLETGKVSAAQGTMDAVLELQSSGIKELATIGKAAAIAQATINTYQGATMALAQGGFWGIAMAAAVIAAGIANIAKIAGVTFAEGGIVPGNSFVGDNVIARVNSGEMVLNRNQQARLFDMANGGGALGSGAGGNTINITQEVNIESGADIEGIIDALRRGTLEALEMANLTVAIGNKQASRAV